MADMAIRLAKQPPASPTPSWESFLKGRSLKPSRTAPRKKKV